MILDSRHCLVMRPYLQDNNDQQSKERKESDYQCWQESRLCTLVCPGNPMSARWSKLCDPANRSQLEYFSLMKISRSCWSSLSRCRECLQLLENVPSWKGSDRSWPSLRWSLAIYLYHWRIFHFQQRQTRQFNKSIYKRSAHALEKRVMVIGPAGSHIVSPHPAPSGGMQVHCAWANKDRVFL